MECGVQTEFGGLRKVLMHRLTEEFQREHTIVTDVLRGDQGHGS